MNGPYVNYSVSELVFFEPSEAGPACLWARDGDKYYFANQIFGQQEMVQWLGTVTTTIDGFVDGKKVQPELHRVEAGARAAIRLLAAINLIDFLNPDQPIDDEIWQREVVTGIKNNRPYLRLQFGVPRQIDGRVNGKQARFKVSEVVYFEPRPTGPVVVWARNGGKYYAADQHPVQEEIVKWLGKVQKK